MLKMFLDIYVTRAPRPKGLLLLVPYLLERAVDVLDAAWFRAAYR